MITAGQASYILGIGFALFRNPAKLTESVQ